MPRVEGGGGGRDEQDSDAGDDREGAAANKFEPEDQSGERDAGQHHAAPVETRGAFDADLRHDPDREHETRDPDRHVDVEDPAPAECGDEQAADRRPEQRSERRRDEKPVHDRDQLAFRGGLKQHEPADRDHHRAAGALQQAGCDEDRKTSGQAAEDRAEREQGDRGGEHGAGAEPVADPTGRRDEDAEAHEIGGQRVVRLVVRHGERPRDVGQRDVDDGGV